MQDSDKQENQTQTEQISSDKNVKADESTVTSGIETPSDHTPDKGVEDVSAHDKTPDVSKKESPAKTEAKPSIASSAPKTSEKSIAQPTSGKSSFGLIFQLLIIVLITGLAGGGYWLFEQNKNLQLQVSSLKTSQALIKKEQKESKDSLTQLSTSQEAAVKSLTQLTGENEQQQKQLVYVSEQMASLTGVRRQDWEIARLEYLLKIASQRLQLDGDLEGAIATLLAADEYLKLLDDPRLISVRKQVSQDLLALQQTERIDRTGAYLALETLIEQIPALQPDQPQFEVVDNTTSSSDVLATSETNFASWLTNKLDGLVRLTPNEVKPTASWLSSDAKAQFNAMLALRLLHAQQALMAENQEVYEAALAQAKLLLETLYLGRSSSNAFIQEISRLQEKKVSMASVDIGGSHLALKQYMEEAQQKLREHLMRSMIKDEKTTPAASNASVEGQ